MDVNNFMQPFRLQHQKNHIPHNRLHDMKAPTLNLEKKNQIRKPTAQSIKNQFTKNQEQKTYTNTNH